MQQQERWNAGSASARSDASGRDSPSRAAYRDEDGGSGAASPPPSRQGGGIDEGDRSFVSRAVTCMDCDGSTLACGYDGGFARLFQLPEEPIGSAAPLLVRPSAEWRPHLSPHGISAIRVLSGSSGGRCLVTSGGMHVKVWTLDGFWVASFGQSQAWPASLRTLMLPGREAVATTAGGIASDTSRAGGAGSSSASEVGGAGDDGFCSALSFGWKRLQVRPAASVSGMSVALGGGGGEAPATARARRHPPNMTLDELRTQLLAHPTFGPRLRAAAVAAQGAAASLLSVSAPAAPSFANGGSGALSDAAAGFSGGVSSTPVGGSASWQLTRLIPGEGGEDPGDESPRPGATASQAALAARPQGGGKWRLPAAAPGVAPQAAGRDASRKRSLAPSGGGSEAAAAAAAGAGAALPSSSSSTFEARPKLLVLLAEMGVAGLGGATQSDATPLVSPTPPAGGGRRLATAPVGMRGRKVAAAAGAGRGGAETPHAPLHHHGSQFHVLLSPSNHAARQAPQVDAPAAAPPAPAAVPLEPGLTLEGVEAAQRGLKVAHGQRAAARRVQELALPLHARNPYAYTGGGRWTSTKVMAKPQQQGGDAAPSAIAPTANASSTT